MIRVGSPDKIDDGIGKQYVNEFKNANHTKQFYLLSLLAFFL